MKKREIILVGGGGHCKSCIDVIESSKGYQINGIIDLPSELGKTISGYQVIGNDDDLPSLAKEGKSFLITIGHMGDSKLRKKLFNIIKNNGGNLPVIASPYSIVSKHSKIDEGTIVMHNSIINFGAEIGANCIVNSKALIEHGVVIGDDCHISTNANINGDCIVGNGCFIGSGSTLKNNVRVAEESFVGIGSIVTKSITLKSLYFGNPAKRIKSL